MQRCKQGNNKTVSATIWKFGGRNDIRIVSSVVRKKSSNIRLTSRREENSCYFLFSLPQLSWPNADTHRESGFFYTEA